MKRRLSVENRMLIEQLLRLNYKLKDIAYYVEWGTTLSQTKNKHQPFSYRGQSMTR